MGPFAASAAGYTTSLPPVVRLESYGDIPVAGSLKVPMVGGPAGHPMRHPALWNARQSLRLRPAVCRIPLFGLP